MSNNIKINLDFNKFSWYIGISILSFIFAIFALVYKPEFVSYGFITFAYGVIAWLVDTTFHQIVKNKESKFWILFLSEIALLGIWIYSLNSMWFCIQLNAK